MIEKVRSLSLLVHVGTSVVMIYQDSSCIQSHGLMYIEIRMVFHGSTFKDELPISTDVPTKDNRR